MRLSLAALLRQQAGNAGDWRLPCRWMTVSERTVAWSVRASDDGGY
jgi:hypothetical protein